MAPPAVLVAGETLVDFIPDEPVPLDAVEGFRRRPGGAPANVAVALARLGVDAPFLTNVARDPFGDYLAMTLAAEGVPGRFVTRDSDRRTALAFVSGDPDADYRFTFYREDTADVHLDDADVPDAVLEAVSWVVVGGVMLAAEPGRSAVISLAERARAAGCGVVFDPNARPELWPDADAFETGVRRLLAHTSVLKVSRADVAGTAFEHDDVEGMARALAAAGPHTVVVTLGAEGAFAIATEAAPWGPGTVRHPGYDVAAVDDTGAGDAFTAGLVAGLVDGVDLSPALDTASAVAALAVSGTGAMTSLPDRTELERFRESVG